jgi:predicted peptidase
LVPPRPLTFRASDGSELSYLLHLPPGHAAAGDGAARTRWPLVLFLHGAGERGHDPARVLRHGLAKRLRTLPDYPAIVISPQCPGQTTWVDHLLPLLELLAEAESRLRGDPDRVHVTGLSMGGMGAWLLGALAPERFASVVPICGLVPPVESFFELLEGLKTRRVWAFHGVEDPVVPVDHTLAIVEALRRRGGQPRLTLYPDVGHRSWEPAYDDAELLRWFLS